MRNGNYKLPKCLYFLCPVPSYQVLYQLIHREWRTELTLKTDENGEASFRGYYGIYDVKVGEDSYEIDFSVS